MLFSEEELEEAWIWESGEVGGKLDEMEGLHVTRMYCMRGESIFNKKPFYPYKM